MHHVETQPTNILAKIKFWQVTRGRYSKVIYEQELATRACLRFDTHINNEYVLYDNDVSDFLMSDSNIWWVQEWQTRTGEHGIHC